MAAKKAPPDGLESPILIDRAIFPLHKGLKLIISPVNGYAQRMLLRRAEELYPDPDRTPYEVVMEDALVPGTKLKAEDSLEWRELKFKALKKRQSCYIGLLLDTCITVDDREAVCAPYAREIEFIREAGMDTDEAAGFVSDFVLLLLTKFTMDGEIGALIRVCQGATPLDEAEIIDGLRYFRKVELSRPERRKTATGSKSQGIHAGEQAADA